MLLPLYPLGYASGSALDAGKTLADIDRATAYFPDNEIVRTDLLDYALEIEHFDAHVGAILDFLQSEGELENTRVIVTRGDCRFDGARSGRRARYQGWAKNVTSTPRPFGCPCWEPKLKLSGARSGRDVWNIRIRTTRCKQRLYLSSPNNHNFEHHAEYVARLARVG